MQINRIQHIVNDCTTRPQQHQKLMSILHKWKSLDSDARELFTKLYCSQIEEYSFAVRKVDPENIIVSLNREIDVCKRIMSSSKYNEDETDNVLDTLMQLQDYREQLREKLLKGEKVELI